ncbi:hypothetical protein NC99_43310 [Sunxiuqinia dokdonensis]|uniref:Uncharacterized protein n=1 Tax=Sunxiuqinia dokdonensis TaxID=1409788 RepID=A0A0L8V3E1_9BACT|nr:hypothetical protein NC99_43310 [Sunxiuqinia dokdonensis]
MMLCFYKTQGVHFDQRHSADDGPPPLQKLMPARHFQA